MGKLIFLTAAVWVLAYLWPASSAPVIDNPVMAMQYLMQYNYLQQSDMSNGVMMSEEKMTGAIETFQRMANITINGKLDNETMAKMNQPRCGVPDMMFNVDAARRKRYSAGRGWSSTSLTWRVDNVTPDFGTPDDIVGLMRYALQFWAEVSGLTFTQLPAQDPNADIIISFASFSHGDGNPFDGRGMVLAHAYFPGSGIGGDAHFDDSEVFVAAGGVNTINLLQVAVHEFGHSLGLAHSNVDAAVMAPFYSGYDPAYALHPDDIAGIRSLYGPNSGGNPEVTMPPVTMPENVPCSGRFDTVTRSSDGVTYAFRGDLVFKFVDSGVGIEDGFPARISEVFAGLPNDLDAAVFWIDVEKTYFFKGDQYYRVTGTTVDSGYPRPISAWNGLPNNIDAAFQWAKNGRIYFIKGDQYFRYNAATRRIDRNYPRPLSVWRGLPPSVDAALQWTNGRTYFFSGEQYWRFNDGNFRTDNSYPRSTVQYWIGCGQQNLVVATTPNPNGAATHYSVATTALVVASAVVNSFWM